MITIDSLVDTGRRIFAVIVPYLACPAYRQAGEEAYAQADGRRFIGIYFQDKNQDRFLVK